MWNSCPVDRFQHGRGMSLILISFLSSELSEMLVQQLNSCLHHSYSNTSVTPCTVSWIVLWLQAWMQNLNVVLLLLYPPCPFLFCSYFHWSISFSVSHMIPTMTAGGHAPLESYQNTLKSIKPPYGSDQFRCIKPDHVRLCLSLINIVRAKKKYIPGLVIEYTCQASGNEVMTSLWHNDGGRMWFLERRFKNWKSGALFSIDCSNFITWHYRSL